MNRLITEFFDVRSDCDYDDYYVISKAEVKQQIANAKQFYDKITLYVSDRL